MIFNPSGRMINTEFNIIGNPLEAVSRFCYLGFEVCPSGTITYAMKAMVDKGKKAMRPLMGAIAKFDIPTKTAIKLFHTFISPIILYNVENWCIFTDKRLEKYTDFSLFAATDTSLADTLHRKFLKYLLGLNKSAPNLPAYGETNEMPLSFEGFR